MKKKKERERVEIITAGQVKCSSPTIYYLFFRFRIVRFYFVLFSLVLVAFAFIFRFFSLSDTKAKERRERIILRTENTSGSNVIRRKEREKCRICRFAELIITFSI
jgi:hypothetical protein